MSTDTAILQRNLNSRPLKIARGSGVYVHGEDGERYLDAMASAAVVAIGHGRTEIYRALAESAADVPFVYGAGFTHRWQEELAERLAAKAPEGLDAVYFTSGGSEANESAIKLARQYFVERGKPQKHKIVSRWQSYHGVTLATLSASGRTSWRSIYAPYLIDVARVEPPYEYRCRMCREAGACTLACADDLERAILLEGADNVAMFIAEPVVGTTAAGLTPPPDYYRRVREICDRYDVLFVADEVLCGYGRTGQFFAIDHWGTRPDILTMGKGIASGYAPLGAMLVGSHIVDALRNGTGQFNHGFTYSGIPVSCFIGARVLDILEAEELDKRAAEIGAYLQACLRELSQDHRSIGDVRGLGLLAGVEFVADRETRMPFAPSLGFTTRLAAEMRSRGVLINPGVPLCNFGRDGDHIQISPPLTISRSEVDTIVNALDGALRVLAPINSPAPTLMT